MFMGPYEEGGDWSDKGIVGIDRFVNRVWRLANNFAGTEKKDCDDKEILRIMHGTIKSVNEDTEDFKFNTALSRIMEYVNALYKVDEHSIARENLDNLALLLAPFAPHFSEELWERLGHDPSVFDRPIPDYKEEFLQESTVDIVVQVNGKVRDTFKINADSSEDEIKEAALSLEKIQNYIDGKTLVKTIVIPGRLINLVVQ